MHHFRSLQVRVVGIAILLGATAGYCPGQTIRLPYHKETGSEATTTAGGGVTPSKLTREDTCWLFPLLGTTCAGAAGPGRNANINKFYDTAGSFSYFNQIKSTYNGASGSTTVAADIASLNFPNAMQVTL